MALSFRKETKKMAKHTPEERQLMYDDMSHRTTWCGPYSVAAVCGTQYEEAYRIIRKIRGKRHAKVVSNDNIRVACNSLGVKGDWKKLPKRKRLSKVLPLLEQGKVYIVQVTKHVIVVDTRDFTTIDNQSQVWEAMEMSSHLTKLAHSIFEVKNPKLPVPSDFWLFNPMGAA